jgi:hypothetical protein
MCGGKILLGLCVAHGDVRLRFVWVFGLGVREFDSGDDVSAWFGCFSVIED